MGVKFELPIGAIEPLFTALHGISPTKVNRLEMKAISLLKSELHFQLEKMMETPEEKQERQLEFRKLFDLEREKKNQRIKAMEQRI